MPDTSEDTTSQGGSESDNSRTDGKTTRTGSTKKPASFKPISFAKFSVPKAPGSNLSPKPPEKGMVYFQFVHRVILTSIATLSSSTLLGTHSQSTRPRLVAKTTSSIRDSVSKLGTSAARPGIGPDPNRVWNKNRRTPDFFFFFFFVTSQENVSNPSTCYSGSAYAPETIVRRRTETAIWHTYDFSYPGRQRWNGGQVG